MRELKRELWPHRITLKIEEFDDSMYNIEIWLGENLGSFKGRWNVVHRVRDTDFYFKEGRDATMFSLRWA